MQITSKARSISTNEMNEGFATWNSDSWNLPRRVFVHWRACSRLLPVVLARAHGNPGSGINGVSWVGKQQTVASKAKVMTKIRKTKRASKDMLSLLFRCMHWSITRLEHSQHARDRVKTWRIGALVPVAGSYKWRPMEFPGLENS